MTNKWRPIETAPRDGSVFLIYIPGWEYEVGKYDPILWGEFVHVGDGLFKKVTKIASEWRGFNNFSAATHWTPIPEPPESE